VIGGDLARLAGGKGANQAAAAARLGARTAMVGSVGDDETGSWLVEELATMGVDVSRVARRTRPTGTAFITVDDRGENAIVVAPGANGDVDASGAGLEEFDVVLAQLEVPAAAVDDVARRARALVLNVAPAAPVDPITLGRCAVVIANELEAASLDLASLAHCVVTLGARGAVHYRYGREVARASALSVEPVDTVGAGDVFCAAYATQYAKRVEAREALRFAAAAGSLATRARGARGALPTETEVKSWLARAS
jgi:ribokinase